MSIAQRLYENGFITYMRTDSITLSESAVAAARDQVRELFGAEYLPDAPRTYQSKVKNAQEAHEAIRPAGERFRTPAETGLSGDEFRLYELIWMRTVASQMKDAKGNSVTVRLGGTASTGEDVVFSASGRTITFHGFLKAYVEGSDDPEKESDDSQTRLPNVSEGDAVSAASLNAAGHETKPPARYTEATLVRELEEREIGRPSTYASIINTILNRGYVYKKGTALVPAWLAFSVIRLMEEHFPRLVSYEFTAGMEDALDEIAAGRRDRNSELAEFYFGSADQEGLQKLVSELGDIDAKELATFPVGEGIDLRVGRYGPYVEDSEGKRGNVPDDLPPDELTVEKAKEMLANPAGAERELGKDPETGHTVVAKNGRFGPYVTEVLPEGSPKSKKPRTSSLFKTMDLDTITLEQALQLLTIPRLVGEDPESGEEIFAHNGKFGPYLKKGTDSRSFAGGGEDPHDDARGGPRDLQAAQDPWAGGGQPGSRDRRRPGDGCEDHGQGRSLRPLRHRRRVQRHPAPGRRRGHHHPRAGRRAARREEGEGPGAEEEDGQEVGCEEDDCQEDHREEDDCQEDHRQEEVLTLPVTMMAVDLVHLMDRIHRVVVLHRASATPGAASSGRPASRSGSAPAVLPRRPVRSRLAAAGARGGPGSPRPEASRAPPRAQPAACGGVRRPHR